MNISNPGENEVGCEEPSSTKVSHNSN